MGGKEGTVFPQSSLSQEEKSNQTLSYGSWDPVTVSAPGQPQSRFGHENLQRFMKILANKYLKNDRLMISLIPRISFINALFTFWIVSVLNFK